MLFRSTSYFGKVKKLPENIIPVSIAAITPRWFQGKSYKQLAPTFELLNDWKIGAVTEEKYTERYNAQLERLDPKEVAEELKYFLPAICVSAAFWEDPNLSIALLCYERDGFCHRHLAANWFTEYGIRCEELII